MVEEARLAVDGSAFIIPKPVGGIEGRERPELRIVLNWAEWIRDLLPKPE